MKKTSKQLLEERQQGLLPVISIAGDKFLIDWSKRLLLLSNNHSICIDISHLPLAKDTTHYYFCYHLPGKQKVQLSANITTLPKDTVMIEIPREAVLDPVGVAREMGREDTFLLKAFPLQEELTATVIPLEQTKWANIVNDNKARKKQSWLKRISKRGLR